MLWIAFFDTVMEKGAFSLPKNPREVIGHIFLFLLVGVMGGLVARGFFPEIKIVEIPATHPVYGYAEKGGEIPLEYRGGQFFVRVTVNRTAQGTFLIDTGSSTTLISHHIASAAGVIPKEESVRLKTLSGEFDAPTAVLASMTMGAVELSGVRVAVAELGEYDGIIGVPVLMRYKIFIDPERMILKLEKIEHSRAEEPF